MYPFVATNGISKLAEKMEILTSFCIGKPNLMLYWHIISNIVKNASYISPEIQNTPIKLCGLEIRDYILHDVRSAKFFS